MSVYYWEGLTGDDLKHSVFLHVSREVPSSHILLHDPHVCEFLKKSGRKMRLIQVMLLIP